MFWQGVKSFMGKAGRGPCAASADLQERLSQGHEVVQEKVQGHLLKIWTNREGRPAVHGSES